VKAIAAPGELAALIAKSRPDWDAERFDGAIEAARSAHWSWDRLAAEVFRLYRIDDSDVGDLLQAIKDPRSRVTERADPHGWASHARQLLDEKRAAAETLNGGHPG